MAPPVTTPTPHNLSVRPVLEKDKLNHSIFVDWYRNLRGVLKHERKYYVLESLIPVESPALPKAAHDAWLKYLDDSIDVSCLMLETMIPDLHINLEQFPVYDMLVHLKEMFQQLARNERFDTVRALHACKMEEGQSVSTYVLKMKSHIDHLERLECPVSSELATDLILNSLSKSYDSFVMNYNMNGWNKSVSELHMMLKTAKNNIPKKSSNVLMIREGRVKKAPHPKANFAKGNGKGKKVTPPPPQKKKLAKEDKCFECGVIGHWKRTVPLTLLS